MDCMVHGHVYFGLPGGSDGKAFASNAGNPVQSLGWEDPWRRKWQGTPAFLPGKSHSWRSLIGYSPRGHSQTAKWLHFQFSLCLSESSYFPLKNFYLSTSDRNCPGEPQTTQVSGSVHVIHFSCVCVWPPWTITYQASLFMGFSKARILEWVPIPSFRGSDWPRNEPILSPAFSALQLDSLQLSHQRSPRGVCPDFKCQLQGSQAPCISQGAAVIGVPMTASFVNRTKSGCRLPRWLIVKESACQADYPCRFCAWFRKIWRRNSETFVTDLSQKVTQNSQMEMHEFWGKGHTAYTPFLACYPPSTFMFILEAAFCLEPPTPLEFLWNFVM